MQRQSLGSPGPKPHVSGTPGGAGKEEKRKSVGVATGSPAAVASAGQEVADEADKLIRASSRADRSIHLIPVFTILCLLVLYLLSHEPQLKDLPSFGGSTLRSDSRVAVSGAKKGGVASAIHQSRRGLKKTASAGGRKLGKPLALPRARADWGYRT